MFNISRNRQSAVDKSVQKALDPKKDFQARIKHLKELLSLPVSAELLDRLHEHKEHLLETFLTAFRATDVWHKSQKSTKNVLAEYEVLLSVLEKLFATMPDVLSSNRWEQPELISVFKKLFHPATSSRIRLDSIRCFLLYYCIVAHDAGDDIHRLFRSIIPVRNYSSTSNSPQTSTLADNPQRWPLPTSSSVASIVSSKSTASTAATDKSMSTTAAPSTVSFFDGITPIVVPHQNEKPLYIRQQNALEVLLLELVKTTGTYGSLSASNSGQAQQSAKPTAHGATISSTITNATATLTATNSHQPGETVQHWDKNDAVVVGARKATLVFKTSRFTTGSAAFQFLWDNFKSVYAARIVPATFKFIPFSSLSTATSPTLLSSEIGSSAISSTPSSSAASSPPPFPNLLIAAGHSSPDSFENLANVLPLNEDEDQYPLMSAMLAQFLCSVLLKTSQLLELKSKTELMPTQTFPASVVGRRSVINGAESLDAATTNFSPLTHNFKFDDGAVEVIHLNECAAILVADEDDQMIIHSIMRHALRQASAVLGMRFEPSLSSSTPPCLSPAHAACLLALIIELYKMWLTNKKSVALARDIGVSDAGVSSPPAVISSPEEFAFVQSLLQIFYNSTSIVFLTAITFKTASSTLQSSSASPKRASTGTTPSIYEPPKASRPSASSTADTAVAFTEQQQRVRYYSDHLQVWQRLLETFRMPIMHMDMSLKTWNIILTTLLKVLQVTMPNADERRAASTVASRVSSSGSSTATIGAAGAATAGQWWLRLATSGSNSSAADALLLMRAEKVVLFDAIARHLLQAIMVAYVKGAIHVPLRPELWDDLKVVLSGDKARHSPDVVEQWARIMVTLTRVLCREIYGIALSSSEAGGATAAAAVMPIQTANTLRVPPPLSNSNPSSFSDVCTSAGGEVSSANSSLRKSSIRARPVRFSDPPRTPNSQKQQQQQPNMEAKLTDQNQTAVALSSSDLAHFGNRQDLLSSSDGAVSSSEDEQRSVASSSSTAAAPVKPRRWSSSPKAPPDIEAETTLNAGDPLSALDADVSLTLVNSIAPPDADDVVAVEMRNNNCLPAADLSPTLVVEDEHNSEGTVIPSRADVTIVASANAAASTPDDSSSCCFEQVQQRLHVMAGGTIRGWTPEAVCVVWHRMLGILGNLSETASASSFMPDVTSPLTPGAVTISGSNARSSSIASSSSDSLTNNKNNVNNSMPPEHHELIMRSLDNFAQYLIHATEELQKQRMVKQQQQNKMQMSSIGTTAALATPADDAVIDEDDTTTPTADGVVGLVGEVEDDAAAVEAASITQSGATVFEGGSKSDTEFELLTSSRVGVSVTSLPPSRPSTAEISLPTAAVSTETVGVDSLSVLPSSNMCEELATLRALPPSYAIAALIIEVLDKLDSRPAYVKSVIISYKLLGQILFGSGGDVPGAQYLTHFYRIVHRALAIVGVSNNSQSSPLRTVVASLYQQQQLQQQAVVLETVLLQCILKLLRFAPPQAGVLIDDILYGCERLLLLTRQLTAAMPPATATAIPQQHQRAAALRANEQRTALVLIVVAAVTEFIQRVNMQSQLVFQPLSGMNLQLVPLKAAISEDRIVRMLVQVCVPEFDSENNSDYDTDHDGDFVQTSAAGTKRPAVLATSLPPSICSLATRTKALYLCGVQLLRLLPRLLNDNGAKVSAEKVKESADTTMHKIDMLFGCVLCCLSDINSEICNAAVDTLNLIAWQFLPASLAKAYLLSADRRKDKSKSLHKISVSSKERQSSNSINGTSSEESDVSDDDEDAIGEFFAISVRNVVLCLCRNIQELSSQCLSTDFYAAHGHHHHRASSAATSNKTSAVDVNFTPVAADSTLKPNQQLNEKKLSFGLGVSTNAQTCLAPAASDGENGSVPCVLLWRLVPMCFCLIDWIVQLPLPFLSQDWSQQLRYGKTGSSSTKYGMKPLGGTLKAATGTSTATNSSSSAEDNLLREIEATFRVLTFAEHKLSAGGYASSSTGATSAPPSSSNEATLKRQFFSDSYDDDYKAAVSNKSSSKLPTADLTNSSSSRPSTTSSVSADQRSSQTGDYSSSGVDEADGGNDYAADYNESTTSGYFARRRATKKAAAAAANTSASSSSANHSDGNNVSSSTASRRLTGSGVNSRSSAITKPTSSVRKHSRRNAGLSSSSRNGQQSASNTSERNGLAAADDADVRLKSSSADVADGMSVLVNNTTTFVRSSPRHQAELEKSRPSALFTFRRPSLTTPAVPATALVTAAATISAAPLSRHAATSKSSTTVEPSFMPPSSSGGTAVVAAAAAANVATARIISLLGNYAFRYTLSWLNCDVNVDSLSCPGSDFAEADVLHSETTTDVGGSSGSSYELNKRRSSSVRDDSTVLDADHKISGAKDEVDASLMLTSPNTQWFTIHEVVFSITANHCSDIETATKDDDAVAATSSALIDRELLIPHGVTLHIFLRDLAGRQYWTLRPVYGFRAFVKQLQERIDALNLQQRPLERLSQHHKHLYEGWRHRALMREKQADADVRQSQYTKLSDIIGSSVIDVDDENDVYMQQQRDKFAEIVELINRKCPEMGVLDGRTVKSAKNVSADASAYMSEELEESMRKMLKRQRDRIDECAAADEFDEVAMASAYSPPRPQWAEEAWLYACQFLSQFGYLGDRKRRLFYPLAKSAELVRDLRFLDKRNVRDYHKIGIIYVGAWQESKSSIMQNERGSALFNWFLEQFGWRVELESHCGYMGGLPKSNAHSTSSSGGGGGGGKLPRRSVYFAAPSVEVMTHVSTMIPLGGLQQQNSQQHDYTSRMRHIGNDSVIVVWSENWHDYDRNTIKTNFADVIICIYPHVDTGLFRVSVVKKPGIPSFGPLQPSSGGEAELRLVDADVLAPLVRATTINASRAIRAAMPNWQWFFEERAAYLANVISKHTSVDTHSGLMRSLLGLSYAENNNVSGAEKLAASKSDDQSIVADDSNSSDVTDSVEKIENRTRKPPTRPRQLSVAHILEQLRAHGSSSHRSGVGEASLLATGEHQPSASSRTTLDDEYSILSSMTRGRSRSEGEVQTPPGVLAAAGTSAAAAAAAAAAAVPHPPSSNTTSSYLRELLHSKRRHQHQQQPTAVHHPPPLLESVEEPVDVPVVVSTVNSSNDSRPWLVGLPSIGAASIPSDSAINYSTASFRARRQPPPPPPPSAPLTAAAAVDGAREVVSEPDFGPLPPLPAAVDSESEAEVDDGGSAANEYGFESMYDYPAAADELQQHTAAVPVIARPMPTTSTTTSSSAHTSQKIHITTRKQHAAAPPVGSANTSSELSDCMSSYSSASSSPAPPPTL